MSGVVHEPEVDEEELEEEDFVADWFRDSGDDEALVLHHKDCATHGSYTICDCIPVTLQRGAKA